MRGRRSFRDIDLFNLGVQNETAVTGPIGRPADTQLPERLWLTHAANRHLIHVRGSLTERKKRDVASIGRPNGKAVTFPVRSETRPGASCHVVKPEIGSSDLVGARNDHGTAIRGDRWFRNDAWLSQRTKNLPLPVEPRKLKGCCVHPGVRQNAGGGNGEVVVHAFSNGHGSLCNSPRERSKF